MTTPTMKVKLTPQQLDALYAVTHNQWGVYVGDSVTTFMQLEMYIDATTPPLPLVLHAEQSAVLNEMFRVRRDGTFVYSTMIYSSIKKSAKTTIGAGVGLWQAWRIPNAHVYVIGNDLRQADNRMAEAMRYCIQHNPRMMAHCTIVANKITLPNGSIIESIPIDPRGEAGMNPDALLFTELWGAKQSKHEEMWSEARLSPTKQGVSFKFVESYAGHTGESNVLWRLYDGVVNQGSQHPRLPEVYTAGDAICYWNTRPYLAWQTDEYYAAERREMHPDEFLRVHRNQWASSNNAFIIPEFWHACAGDVSVCKSSLIIGVDAGVKDDTFAIVAVGKHNNKYYVAHVQTFTPKNNQPLDFGMIANWLSAFMATRRITQICYDPFQLHAFMQSFSRTYWVSEFNQGVEREHADKFLMDTIQQANIVHPKDNTLTEHIINARAKLDGKESNRLRIVKGSHERKVDAAVALSMALYRASQLNL